MLRRQDECLWIYISNIYFWKYLDRGTVFINVGRGSIIADADLIEALDKKWLSAAILDVFNEEPLSESSLLWSMPQVLDTCA